jgi:aspartyl-tRNA(Asn)/glutamyl-tRNA(Gln) amidotransferase subunit A
MAQEITDDILYAPLRELATLLQERKITSVALTEAYLHRLDKLGPKLNAVVMVTRDLARKEARAADKEIQAGHIRGPLHGIPCGVKDLFATKGLATSWGAEPFKNQVFDYDATVIRKLREVGAVLVAKLAMVELAGGFGYNTADASFTGPGRNPWDPAYWAGGSSSGPGAAVAAALVPFAIGSETSGSIITPAAFCGIAGLRPTYGRISRHGAMALSWTLDKLGPMCRTADDCGLVLAALAGADPLDPTCADKPFVYPKAEKKRYKLGVPKNATSGAQPEVKKNFEESLKVLRQFADVEEGVELPDFPFSSAVNIIISAEMASAFRDFIESGRSKELRAPHDRTGGYAASLVLAVDYLQALRVRGLMKKALDELYAKYDALVAPARGTVALAVGSDFDKSYPGFGGGPPLIQAGNLAGQPALSIPNGFGYRDLPTGLQFTGRAWSEARLIALGQAYQQATAWHKKRPPMNEGR